jgi:ubiquinol-cytochrome c reductase cytochrome b subunit
MIAYQSAHRFSISSRAREQQRTKLRGFTVLAALSNWFDHRTGYRKIVSALLIEDIPGGAKWRYVWGSCLAFVFVVQLITGVLLMTAYSAGDTNAWGSVYFIQYEMDFGWLIRGLHHFGSQTMVVLLAIHMLQVVIAGAHLPPREVNWWLGLALLGCVLGLSLTGYLLPWDQKGYWATKVATNIAGNLPGIGAEVSKIVVGGPEYGNHTLTRFYALHVGILPPLVILLTVLHLVVFRRHGVTTSWPAWLDLLRPRWPGRHKVAETGNDKKEGWFWPDQAFRDMLVCIVIFGVIVGLVVYGHGHKIQTTDAETERSLYDKLAHAGRDGKGANLDAPADPGVEYPARPEWYFLFLFQLLKHFEGSQEIIGTLVIPNGVMVLLAFLPLLALGRTARGGIRSFAHALSMLMVVGLLCGVVFLTYEAVAADRPPADLSKEQVAALESRERDEHLARKSLHEKLKEAEKRAGRAVELARFGIPAEGARNLLRHDPLTQGKDLFQRTCAVCHTHGAECKNNKPTAPDLAGFGTEEWLNRFLNNPAHPDYFGRTRLTTMSEWMESNFPNTGLNDKQAAKLGAEERSTLEKDRSDLRSLAKWLAMHPRKDSAESNIDTFRDGVRLFKERGCTECHTYEGKGGKRGPDLTGYGDQDWVRLTVMAPYHSSRYGIRNLMPAFRDLEGPTAAVTLAEIAQARNLLSQTAKKTEAAKVDEATRVLNLSDIDRELIIRWLLKDDRVIFGGAPISGASRE